MIVSRIVLLMVTLTLGLSACGGGDGNSGSKYPSSVEDNFLSACKTSSGGNEDACKCALRKLEDTLPYEDFKAADAAVRKGEKAAKDVSGKVTNAISSCT